ncbi:hypothetical protein [Kitasatospora sp. NPDC056531]|uniref:hypothetical protein n=1 Tax=Kitasatospora sp. NPDC056531 TaxID=3345856 RepID=UPI0036B7FDD9
MSAILLSESIVETRSCDTLAPSTLLERDDEPSARACPVCGSSATYQTMNGRWGCTVCVATWA